MPIFQEKLKEAMLAKKISQRRLASALGIKQATIWKWLNTEASPSLERFQQICEVVGVSADYLLGRN